LSTNGRFIAVLPVSVLRFNPGLFALKELGIDLQVGQLPALMVTLEKSNFESTHTNVSWHARAILPTRNARGAGVAQVGGHAQSRRSIVGSGKTAMMQASR